QRDAMGSNQSISGEGDDQRPPWSSFRRLHCRVRFWGDIFTRPRTDAVITPPSRPRTMAVDDLRNAEERSPSRNLPRLSDARWSDLERWPEEGSGQKGASRDECSTQKGDLGLCMDWWLWWIPKETDLANESDSSDGSNDGSDDEGMVATVGKAFRQKAEGEKGGSEGAGVGCGRKRTRAESLYAIGKTARWNKQRVKRMSAAENLRNLNKRYDPDAESAYSRSTGTPTDRSSPGPFIELTSAKHPTISQEVNSLRERLLNENEWQHHCLFTGHLWRRGYSDNERWMVVDGCSMKRECDGSGEEYPKEHLWECDLDVCRANACTRCMKAWEEERMMFAKEQWEGSKRPTDKTSLTTSNTNRENGRPEGSRSYSAIKQFGGDGTAATKPSLNGIAPVTTTGVASPTSGASSAFGLGSGAFASFGSSAKTPKTSGTALEPASSVAAGKEREKDPIQDSRGLDGKTKSSASSLNNNSIVPGGEHPIKHTWVVWYRPPTSKFQDYEKSTVPLAHFSTIESFWTVYTHLKRPSSLPSVSDYHLFKKGIRPVWEDEENKRGGKWIVRLKKGVSDRYWEDLLLAIIGDQFAEAGEEVCGAVLSVRSGEDVLSVWTRIDGGRNIKIRETIKRVLAFPPDTSIIWKSHDDSIAQRSAIDQARQEKGAGTGKRRETMSGDPASEKAKG
ncbi:MAG: hypothetical protein Q9181_006799, partial [Wetmoreana brouardii]